MAVKVCSTALNQGGLRVEVGTVHDSTAWYVATYPSFFSDPITYKRNVVTTGGVFATPIVLTAAQSGSIILLDTIAGLQFTLPAIAAADIGIWYQFVCTASVTSNSYKIVAATGDFLNGGVWIADFNTASTGAYFAADGTSHLTMTMDGTTKGGKIGTVVEVTAINATGWYVAAPQYFGDGVLATPFS